jgi:hypothetical protein
MAEPPAPIPVVPVFVPLLASTPVVELADPPDPLPLPVFDELGRASSRSLGPPEHALV